MPIVVRIDVELARQKMSVGEFAERVSLTPANVAVLKNGRAKAVRFSTLEAMCRVLKCQPGDLREFVEDSGKVPSPCTCWGANRPPSRGVGHLDMAGVPDLTLEVVWQWAIRSLWERHGAQQDRIRRTPAARAWEGQTSAARARVRKRAGARAGK